MSRHLRRRLPTWPSLAAATLILIAAWRFSLPSLDPDRTLPDPQRFHFVERVIDGDTLVLATGQRVRLIGVDTPETKHPDRLPEPFGREAADFTRRLVEGRQVRLEYDRERLDIYRRLLAYVYVDGELLNERLIREGLSPARTGFSYRSDMQRRFRAAEEEARAAERSGPPRRRLWRIPHADAADSPRSHRGAGSL